MAKAKETLVGQIVEPGSSGLAEPVNPGYVRIQNLQPIEQTIPLIDGGEPLCLTPLRGKGNTSRPVLNKLLPAAFIERLVKEKKIRKLI